MRKPIIVLALATLLVFTLGGCLRLFAERPQDNASPDKTGEINITPDRADYEIIHDLTGLNLIDHDFNNSALLTQTTLRTLLGQDIAEVIIIYDGELEKEDGHIFNDAWPIGMYYFTRQHETAVDSVLWSLAFDKENDHWGPAPVLTVGAVRTSADEQMAMLVVLDEGDKVLHVYAAQNIPDRDDVVVLDTWILLEYLETRDELLLAELGVRTGIDFRALITEGAGHLLAEPLDRTDYEIAHDLTGLNLIDHDLSNSTWLEQTTLRTFLGRGIADVIVIRDGDLHEENGHIRNSTSAWVMGMDYFTRHHETAVDSVIWSLEEDKRRDNFGADPVLTIGPVYTDANEQAAMMVVLEEDYKILMVYTAQNIPDSNDVVVLDIWILLEGLEDHDERILAEFGAHIGIDLEALITDHLPSEHDAALARADYEIIHDLTGLNLIDHDLGDSTRLEQATLRTMQGRDIVDVTVISGEDIEIEDGFIFSNSETWSIVMFYADRQRETAVDSAIRSMEQDKEDSIILDADSTLTIGPVRASADEQTAMLIVREETPDGFVAFHIYMAQNIPNSNTVVVLTLWLWADFFEGQDRRILAELSDHIGVDFQAIITEFTGSPLPEEVV